VDENELKKKPSRRNGKGQKKRYEKAKKLLDTSADYIEKRKGKENKGGRGHRRKRSRVSTKIGRSKSTQPQNTGGWELCRVSNLTMKIPEKEVNLRVKKKKL